MDDEVGCDGLGRQGPRERTRNNSRTAAEVETVR